MNGDICKRRWPLLAHTLFLWFFFLSVYCFSHTMGVLSKLIFGIKPYLNPRRWLMQNLGSGNLTVQYRKKNTVNVQSQPPATQLVCRTMNFLQSKVFSSFHKPVLKNEIRVNNKNQFCAYRKPTQIETIIKWTKPCFLGWWSITVRWVIFMSCVYQSLTSHLPFSMNIGHKRQDALSQKKC